MCIRDSAGNGTDDGAEVGNDVGDADDHRREHGIGPVSYTHLDVYKRQGPEMPEHFKKNSINCEKSVTDATEISQFTDLQLAL